MTESRTAAESLREAAFAIDPGASVDGSGRSSEEGTEGVTSTVQPSVIVVEAEPDSNASEIFVVPIEAGEFSEEAFVYAYSVVSTFVEGDDVSSRANELNAIPSFVRFYAKGSDLVASVAWPIAIFSPELLAITVDELAAIADRQENP